MNQTKQLMSLAAEIDCQTSVAGVWEVFGAALARLDLTHYIFLMIDADGSRPEMAATLSLEPPGSVSARDPFLQYCCRSFEATLTGITHLGDYPYLPDSARSYIEGAAEHGFTSGLAIPVRLRGGPRYGGFNLGSDMPREAFARHVLPHLDVLRFLCLIAERRRDVLRQAERRPAPSEEVRHLLTPREFEILERMSTGMTRRQCAAELAVRESTVATHLKSAFDKLGVRSMVEAAHVLYRGPPPPSADDPWL
ncbi:helix-turn-helix transcriptional regulator [Acuticoccus sediminis]|uniref:helix-turn-helix transcriptional regulator n=1 Tax=Acuticoccus sediminis TaxID=2184697 RepID=UPI001391370E|nr:LuxR C-terminal-related transcriptional regulator [Acuticoccus sediminis]